MIKINTMVEILIIAFFTFLIGVMALCSLSASIRLYKTVRLNKRSKPTSEGGFEAW